MSDLFMQALRAQAPLQPKEPRLLEFFVRCNPPTATHHHKKIVKKGRNYSLADKPELLEAKESLASLFAPFAPTPPIEGAVRLDLQFQFGWLKSATQKQRAEGSAFKLSKPDCSNLAKVVEDVMTRLAFWHDDGQIVSLSVSKGYCDQPGIRVRVTRL